MIARTKKVVIRVIEILVIILMLSLATSYVYFRYFKETTFRVKEDLSPAVAKVVDNTIDRIDIINGAQIVKVDLQRNVRYIIHAQIKDPELRKLYEEFSNSRITTEIQVFSKDDVQNARIIRLMNHEFDCTPYKNTLSYQLVPESAKFVTTVCSISIPPAFNEFKGIIAVTLSREPSEYEKSVIRIALIELSNRIYEEIK
jgi:hypothetical protein